MWQCFQRNCTSLRGQAAQGCCSPAASALEPTGKSSKRQPLSEEEAIKLGLKKHPCCRYGSHKSEDYRNPTSNKAAVDRSQVNQAMSNGNTKPSQSKKHSKQEIIEFTDTGAERKGSNFYEDDGAFGLVIIHGLASSTAEGTSAVMLSSHISSASHTVTLLELLATQSQYRRLPDLKHCS